jgi:hypothetical protein
MMKRTLFPRLGLCAVPLLAAALLASTALTPASAAAPPLDPTHTAIITASAKGEINTGILQMRGRDEHTRLGATPLAATVLSEPARTVALTDQAEITPRPQNGTLGATLLRAGTGLGVIGTHVDGAPTA